MRRHKPKTTASSATAPRAPAPSHARTGDPLQALQDRADRSPRVGALQALAGLAQAPKQMIKTRAQSVALDLLHAGADTLFSAKPDMSGVAGFSTMAKGAKRAAYIRRLNNARDFSYNQLATGTLTGASQLIALAGVTGKEHMYVHNGGTVHIHSRGSEKQPHPTLVGGDPDVTCAGELHVKEEDFPPLSGPVTYNVGVTTESGHFRPAAVPDGTLTAVRAAAGANVPTGKRVVVDRA